MPKSPCFFAARTADLLYEHLTEEELARLRAHLELTTIEDLRAAVAALRAREEQDAFPEGGRAEA